MKSSEGPSTSRKSSLSSGLIHFYLHFVLLLGGKACRAQVEVRGHLGGGIGSMGFRNQTQVGGLAKQVFLLSHLARLHIDS